MKYTITFYDFWHLSSGTSAGPSMDSLVVKDLSEIIVERLRKK